MNNSPDRPVAIACKRPPERVGDRWRGFPRLLAALLTLGLAGSGGVVGGAGFAQEGGTLRAYQESPSAGSYESGIGVIRGWVCEANQVEIQIDGGERLTAAYGLKRGDTADVCGDTDNGYGLTFNWNQLHEGPHTLRAFADGLEFARVVFNVASLGEDYLQGGRGAFTVADFPKPGDTVHLRWSEPHQNFVIAGYSAAGPYQLFGLNFSPYQDGQDPNLGAFIPEDQLRARMRIIQSHARWIRTFGASNGLEKSGAVARQLGLKAALGAWIQGPCDRNNQANEREIAQLVAAARAGEADLLIVGSEVLLRNECTAPAMIDYLQRVKEQAPWLPVAYADTYAVWLAHPDLIQASDLVLANYYPYWEGIAIDQAVATLHCQHQRLQAAARGKPVMVSETGWPSAGNTVGRAAPTLENANRYFLNFVSWARAQAVQYFYFAAFDEPWKAAYEGPQGARWGVWDQNGILKPGNEAVFAGETLPDDWSAGGCEPAIEFTRIPPYGSFENLRGRVLQVAPADYRVAVYIKVNGGWWTKPYFNAPLTPIAGDGSWECDITTGGKDETATGIAAFLVPKGYNPPPLDGARALPATLYQNAVASWEITRHP